MGENMDMTYETIDGWMGGGRNGRIDGWMEEWDGWMNK